MAQVIIGDETLNTTKHTANFINWCRGFFTDDSAEKVLEAVLQNHLERERSAGRKLNLPESKARKTVDDLCKTTILFRRRDNQQVLTIN